MFEVKRETKADMIGNKIGVNKNTAHILNREERIKAYKPYLDGIIRHAFIVDTGHKNGLEVHMLNEEGIIFIFNLKSGKLITLLYARPGQIRRYFKEPNEFSERVAEKVYKNMWRNLNNK